MDDLSSMLGDFLKNPENMEKIRSLTGMLGGGAAPPPAPASPPAVPPSEPDNRPAGLDTDSMQLVMKLAPMLSRFRQEDDSTRLLRALRPFLNEEKRKKLDEAIRLMQLVRMIPFIRSSGLL